MKILPVLFFLIILFGCKSKPAKSLSAFQMPVVEKINPLNNLTSDSAMIYAIDSITWAIAWDTTLQKTVISDFDDAESRDQLQAFYKGDELVRLTYATNIFDFTDYFFVSGELVCVKEGCQHKAIGSCGTYSDRIQYFNDGARFAKFNGKKYGQTIDETPGWSNDETDRCWCLSRSDEEKLVLDLLAECMERID